MTPEPRSIKSLQRFWHDRTHQGQHRACMGWLALALVMALCMARIGFDWARAGAAFLLLWGLLPLVLNRLWLRRSSQDESYVMRATLLKTEPKLGQATLRALHLAKRTKRRDDTGSADLADLHIQRLLARAAASRIEQEADKHGIRWAAVGLLCVLTALVVVAQEPLRLLEGLDVALSSSDVAPVPIRYLESEQLIVTPPAYLQRERDPIRPYFPAAVPVGSRLELRASPRYADRTLVLSDGSTETTFQKDGDGNLVARWTLRRDSRLVVAAKFGQVRIEQPLHLELQTIEDYRPKVHIEGAPKTVRLLDSPRIPIHWQARDDHQITEVVLVLRAGERVERRRLSKPQSGGRVDRGGTDLLASDSFLQKSHVPIEVSVQARDNNGVAGPQWGRSQSILVIPPDIAELEAMRYAALVRGRNAVTDLLAARLQLPTPTRAEVAAYRKQQIDAHRKAIAVVHTALKSNFGNLRVRGTIAALIRAQLERLAAPLRKTGYNPHLALLRATEKALLALDSGVRAIGQHDVRMAATKLADVAEGVAAAIAKSHGSDRQRVERQLSANLQVLEAGGRNLLLLGRLGLDLGEIVANGLRRIRRAWSANDTHHAKLAAKDLALRLRQPNPSFASSGSGGGHGHGGVEAGGAPQPGSGPASDAADQAKGAEQALEQLRQEHAAEMAQVERTLEKATSPKQRQALRQHLKETAKEMRRIAQQLPKQADQPGSSAGEGSQGRSLAEGAAASLERGKLGEAAKQGAAALQALERAERAGRDGRGGASDRAAGRLAGRARSDLKALLEEVKRQRKAMQRDASDKAADKLSEAAKREEKLAERAQALHQRSAASEAPLPRRLLEQLRKAAQRMAGAAKALKGKRGSEGLEKQRQAQRLLEMSQPEGDPNPGNNDGDGKDFSQGANVPDQKRNAAADRFRERVTKGLNRRVPPHLKGALRRYAEGLLR